MKNVHQKFRKKQLKNKVNSSESHHTNASQSVEYSFEYSINKCYLPQYYLADLSEDEKTNLTEKQYECYLLSENVKHIPLHQIIYGSHNNQYEFDLDSKNESDAQVLKLYIKDKDKFFAHQEAFKYLHNETWQVVPITYKTMLQMQEEELKTVFNDISNMAEPMRFVFEQGKHYN